MAERIELPDGQWVVYRDPTTNLTHRHQAPYLDLLFQMKHNTFQPDADAESSWRFGCAAAYMLVHEWSRTEPVPPDFESFDLLLRELPAAFVGAIQVTTTTFVIQQVTKVTEGTAKRPPTQRARKPAAKKAAKPAKKAVKSSR